MRSGLRALPAVQEPVTGGIRAGLFWVPTPGQHPAAVLRVPVKALSPALQSPRRLCQPHESWVGCSACQACRLHHHEASCSCPPLHTAWWDQSCALVSVALKHPLSPAAWSCISLGPSAHGWLTGQEPQRRACRATPMNPLTCQAGSGTGTAAWAHWAEPTTTLTRCCHGHLKARCLP